MIEFVLICFMLLAGFCVGVLTYVFVRLLKAYLALQIVSSALPAHEKALLLDKTADEVAIDLPRRGRSDDVVPLFGGGVGGGI